MDHEAVGPHCQPVAFVENDAAAGGDYPVSAVQAAAEQSSFDCAKYRARRIARKWPCIGIT